MKHKEINPSTNHDLFLAMVFGKLSQIPVITDSNPPNLVKKSFFLSNL
jgi:hypothetical protein